MAISSPLLLALSCTSAPDTGPIDTGADDSGLLDPDGLTPAEFRDAFVARAVALWRGVDYTAGGRGDPGVDGAGVVVLTLQDMGYVVPDATADQLVTGQRFDFVSPCPASSQEIVDGEFGQLRQADLLSLDYDFDGVWDHVAIFIEGDPPTALTASDYADEVRLEDLSDYDEPLRQDLTWSQVGCWGVEYEGLEGVFGGYSWTSKVAG